VPKEFRNTPIITCFVVAAICIVLGGLACRSDENTPEKFTSRIQIVLDRTSSMQQPFDGVTKFEAAKKATLHRFQNLPDDIHLSLRTYGGACGTENSELAGNVTTITAVMDTLPLQGEGSLLKALQEAIGDAVQVDMPNTLILIAGSVDSCYSEIPPSNFVRTQLTGEMAALDDFRLIGIGLNEDGRRRLEEIAAAIPGSAVFFTDNTDELIRALGPRAEADSLQQAKQVFLSGEALYTQGEFDKARSLFIKAARENIAAATYYLGTIYFYGRGSIPVNYEKALYWYRKGAALNNAIAMFNLGVMFDPDVRLKTISDLDSAKYWYGKAAALGHQKAEQRLQELER